MRENRKNDEIRDINITLNYTSIPDGSVLIECGDTKIICTAMIEDKVPFFLKGKNKGWISCEYSMIPAATQTRKIRDISKGKIDGRGQEIQRLIGRSLRECIDLELIGEKTIWIDCDVISADGSTRTISINGAFIALNLAIKNAIKKGIFQVNPLKCKIGAVSVGIVNNKKLLDLQFSEDSIASVDMNIVMNDKFEIIEIQGTSEKETFNRKELNELLDLSEKGIKEILCLEDKLIFKKHKLVLATDNNNKVLEIKNILKNLYLEILSKKDLYIDDEIEEIENTIEGNALLKARFLSKKCSYCVIADDTGLFVNALNGDPGVKSARYFKAHDDEANRKFLLNNMKNIEDRSAYFKTIIALIDEKGKEYIFEGICEGEITKEPKGENGFGYDNIFIPKGYNKTFAELSSEEKSKISHRKKALIKLEKYLIHKIG